MTDYQTINVITLERLNNAEYLSFMHNVLALLPLASEEEEDRPGGLSVLSSLSENGVPALGLSAEFMNEFEQEIEMLADVVDETRIAPETETMNANDKLRSSVTTFITSNIANACKSPISTEATAGNELYKVIKPYIGIAQLPVDQKTVKIKQKTVKIKGLLLDIRKEENAQYVTDLNLTTYLNELETANNAYMASMQQRLRTRAALKRESGSAIRERVNTMYENLAILAQSYNIVQPTAETTKFVNELNELIAQTTTAYNSRSKRPKNNNNENTPSGGEEERPGGL